MEIALPVEQFHVVKGSAAMLCCGLDLNKTKERKKSIHFVGKVSQHVPVFFLK